MKIYKYIPMFLIIVFAVTVLLDSVVIHNRGTLKLLGLKAYSDPEGTMELNQIDWNLIGQGESKNVTAHLKLTGSTPSTLTLATDKYEPVISDQYLVLTWNYKGEVLLPNTMNPLTITLTVSPNVEGFIEFSFDIIITAEESP